MVKYSLAQVHMASSSFNVPGQLDSMLQRLEGVKRLGDLNSKASAAIDIRKETLQLAVNVAYSQPVAVRVRLFSALCEDSEVEHHRNEGIMVTTPPDGSTTVTALTSKKLILDKVARKVLAFDRANSSAPQREVRFLQLLTSLCLRRLFLNE